MNKSKYDKKFKIAQKSKSCDVKVIKRSLVKIKFVSKDNFTRTCAAYVTQTKLSII